LSKIDQGNRGVGMGHKVNGGTNETQKGGRCQGITTLGAKKKNWVKRGGEELD